MKIGRGRNVIWKEVYQFTCLWIFSNDPIALQYDTRTSYRALPYRNHPGTPRIHPLLPGRPMGLMGWVLSVLLLTDRAFTTNPQPDTGDFVTEAIIRDLTCYSEFRAIRRFVDIDCGRVAVVENGSGPVQGPHLKSTLSR